MVRCTPATEVRVPRTMTWRSTSGVLSGRTFFPTGSVILPGSWFEARSTANRRLERAPHHDNGAQPPPISLPRMNGISAVIITRNEERNIGRCLEPLPGWPTRRSWWTPRAPTRPGTSPLPMAPAWRSGLDQLQRPEELRQRPGLRIPTSFRWMPTRWCPAGLKPSCCCNTKAEGLRGAYRMKRLTNYCGSWVRHGGWYPDAKVRLFPGKARAGRANMCTRRWPPAGHLDHGAGARPAALFLPQRAGPRRADRTLQHPACAGAACTGKHAGWVKRNLSPAFKFVQGYLLQGGFLDGKAGCTIARMSARPFG